ncbi:MAG: hypothetical protein IJS07_06370 [Bacteroidales bacterium]|nr:hypothetical protein [Bacteroidales bacterium]
MAEEKRKWKIKDLGTFLVNMLWAALRGELLIKLNIGKYFPQIIYTFVLFALIILFSLGVDATMVKVENNKEILHDLEVLHTQKSYELQQLNRRTRISSLLEELGSELAPPAKPAEHR